MRRHTYVQVTSHSELPMLTLHTVAPVSKQPIPPVPMLPRMNGGPSIPVDGPSQSDMPPQSFDPHRAISPPHSHGPNAAQGNPNRVPSLREQAGPMPPRHLSSIETYPGNAPMFDPNMPLSAPPHGPVGVGQIFPPPRGDSVRSPPPNGFGVPPGPPRSPIGGPMNAMGPVGPGQFMPPLRGESMRSPPPNGMGIPPQQLPPRGGSLPPRPFMNGPGPGPGPMPGNFPPNMPPRGPMGPPGIMPPPGPGGPPQAMVAMRSPSEPSFQGGVRKSSSSRSLGSQYDRSFPYDAVPPVPPMPAFERRDSFGSMHGPGPLRPPLPLNAFSPRSAATSYIEPSPPNSPVEESRPTGPVSSSVCATMKCKVFLQQQHAQWKSLGAAKLTLYEQRPTFDKQLVVEADNKEKTLLISTIVLTDGVERVGKTGVAIELSDQGSRTGIVYMIQLRNEKSAGGLFDSLLKGSDRAGLR